MTDGIAFHVTEKGKLLIVATKDEQSITFQVDFESAQVLRNELQRSLSELQKDLREAKQ